MLPRTVSDPGTRFAGREGLEERSHQARRSPRDEGARVPGEDRGARPPLHKGRRGDPGPLLLAGNHAPSAAGGGSEAAGQGLCDGIAAVKQRGKRWNIADASASAHVGSYESRRKAARLLSKFNIPVTVIIDTAVAYFMDKVDMVLVGAEGVVENGGLINHIARYRPGRLGRTKSVLSQKQQTSRLLICEFTSAKFSSVRHRRSFKFVRMFPLDQQDFKHSADMIQYTVEDGEPRRNFETDGLEAADPSLDYTPPKYITLLFTDVGVLTPSGVGDSLITTWSD
ncbi:MAG: hypothetical protein BJ554DRAFT_7851 [Olpidium bornovanus]|uniref:Uncharacterized protein n=1 Tax=Olpidium bornovanus TaxID=278681 RepID=A0A8H7ZV06_9FUNG|nr:MAG: hypothetical protein BJ554DRAFT_7851 [Olpidium bornovanus]